MKHYRLHPGSVRRVCGWCALALVLVVSGGCGGKSNNIVIPDSGVTVEPNQKLSTAPHRFDVYRADGADKAIVFLHGGLGTKSYSAYQLGLKRDPDESNYVLRDVKILLDNHAIMVFPQGQAIPAAPLAYTWSNYVMNSGQDDMQFIRELVAYITTHYKVSKIYIAGHSNGGMMVSRIWCEAPELFDGYVSISGPPSEHFLGTPCTPAVVKPFLSIVGGQDDVLQNSDWEAQTWTISPVLSSSPAFVDPNVIGDRYFLPTRVTLSCGGTVQAGDADAVKDGTTATWSFCGGSIRLIRIESAGHSVESLESASGTSLLAIIFGFVDATI